jgi:hypothetical protein
MNIYSSLPKKLLNEGKRFLSNLRKINIIPNDLKLEGNTYSSNGRNLLFIEVFAKNYNLFGADEQYMMKQSFHNILLSVQDGEEVKVLIETKSGLKRYYFVLSNYGTGNISNLQSKAEIAINYLANSGIEAKITGVEPLGYDVIKEEVIDDCIISSANDNKRYHRNYYLTSIPFFSSINWLDPIWNIPQDGRIIISIQTLDKSTEIKKLNRSIKISSILSEQKNVSASTKIAQELELEESQESIQKLLEKKINLQRIKVDIQLTYSSLEELKVQNKSLVRELGGYSIQIRSYRALQYEAFMNNLLFFGSKDIKNSWFIYTSDVVSEFYPFKLTNIGTKGDLIGKLINTNTDFYLDDELVEVRNRLIAGASGSGKTYFTMQNIKENLGKGYKMLIIDPKNEYKMEANKDVELIETSQLTIITSEDRDELSKALDLFWRECIRDNMTECRLYVDEAWELLDSPELLKALTRFAKLGRSFKTGLIIITQSFKDYVNKDAKNIIDECKTKFYFRLSKTAKDDLAKLNLPDVCIQSILNQQKGACILHVDAPEHQNFYNIQIKKNDEN